MRRQLMPAFVMIVLMTVLTGIYTFAFTGFAQVVARGKANGSLVQVDGEDVGSQYIGQAWVDKKGHPLVQYFQSRPSAATNTTDNGYDPTLSLGSNEGPTNPDLLKAVSRRVKAYRTLNGLDDNQTVPVDAVTASASGLDPNISVANARLQAKRVAEERGLSLRKVNQLVDDHTDARTFGILGEKRVNVLKLNLALDKIAPSS
jgi:potassium-transporting ATPase KdpC subunit